MLNYYIILTKLLQNPYEAITKPYQSITFSLQNITYSYPFITGYISM